MIICSSSTSSLPSFSSSFPSSSFPSFPSSSFPSSRYLGMFRSRQSGVAEGCAIFVRLDKFRFIDAHPISLKRDVPVLDRENVGLIVKVK